MHHQLVSFNRPTDEPGLPVYQEWHCTCGLMYAALPSERAHRLQDEVKVATWFDEHLSFLNRPIVIAEHERVDPMGPIARMIERQAKRPSRRRGR